MNLWQFFAFLHYCNTPHVFMQLHFEWPAWQQWHMPKLWAKINPIQYKTIVILQCTRCPPDNGPEQTTTFSTLAYFLISISLRPFSSSSTVRTASSAMLQAKLDQRLSALVLMAELMIFSNMSRSFGSTGVLWGKKNQLTERVIIQSLSVKVNHVAWYLWFNAIFQTHTEHCSYKWIIPQTLSSAWASSACLERDTTWSLWACWACHPEPACKHWLPQWDASAAPESAQPPTASLQLYKWYS